MIEVVTAGLCDLVMDLGRPGYAAQGVPAGGAADPWALAAANRLVGNAAGAAGLECAFAGPTLAFPEGGVVALTGGRFEAVRQRGGRVAWNETLVLAAGETLALGRAIAGCRCWLAVRGGIAVPTVLGSRATFLPAAFGGLAGRALRAGDRLPPGPATGEVRLERARPVETNATAPLRIVAGPQIAALTDAGLLALFDGTFRVAATSDRRGIRLQGPRVTHAAADMPSQGVRPGVLQVPPDGQPIVLGWDGPVTGGYPVVATVIEADWPRLAQLRPGDVVRFATIELAAARALAARAPWTLETLA